MTNNYEIKIVVENKKDCDFLSELLSRLGYKNYCSYSEDSENMAFAKEPQKDYNKGNETTFETEKPQNTALKKRQLSKLRGKMTKQTAQEIENQISKLRDEWKRDM